jgi:DNA uptake protein ComE-like DNA-binding protein
MNMTDLDSLLGASLSREQRADAYRRLFVQINMNTASDAEILLIPGMGNRMLEEFKEYRPYKALAQFRREIGKYVDEKEVARFEQYVFVPINLNTATDADILSIPGMGQRMLREFKEYRPYKAMVQFRREIGKYVDDKELARLEQYVFVPINLNTASDADIMSIPNMGQRMLGEFKEYRPYKAIQQFRKEIGKYVNEKEVARLERYVTLN